MPIRRPCSRGITPLAALLVAACMPSSSVAELPLPGVGLHCCSVDEGHALLLACDADPSDAIIAVPFAAYGKASEGSATCGHEETPACGASVQEAAEARCKGLQRCSLEAKDFEDSCPGAQKELRVRWVCRSDSSPVADVVRDPPAPASVLSLPLRAEGNVIVDASGTRVRLTGVTWGGFHIKNVPGGLDVAPIDSIARVIRQLGFNFVRFTFSAAAVLDNPVVESHRVAANPHLSGKRALDVFDAIVQALDREGILIWLDNHMLESDWCCSGSDCNGLWFNERFSTNDWVEMWRMVAKRYKGYRTFIGVGLKNEPRAVCTSTHGALSCNVSSLAAMAGGNDAPDPYGMKQEDKECVWPQWDSGLEALQFRPAMERAGRAILDEAPDLLIGISGLNYAQWLRDVASSPVDLPKRSVVYEAHEYDWWRDHSPEGNYNYDRNATGAFANYSQSLDTHWGYLLREGIAPVLISEFGMGHRWTEWSGSRMWFSLWSEYAQDKGPLRDQGGVDWAYWQLTGVQSGGTWRSEGSEETFGILNRCWTGPWRETHFEAIQDLGLYRPRLLQSQQRVIESSTNADIADAPKTEILLSSSRALLPSLLSWSLLLHAAWNS